MHKYANYLIRTLFRTPNVRIVGAIMSLNPSSYAYVFAEAEKKAQCEWFARQLIFIWSSTLTLFIRAWISFHSINVCGYRIGLMVTTSISVAQLLLYRTAIYHSILLDLFEGDASLIIRAGAKVLWLRMAIAIHI